MAIKNDRIKKMGLYVNRNQNRSKLQERLNAELQERNKGKQYMNAPPEPDKLEKSVYFKEMENSSAGSWIWIILILVAIGIFLYFIFTIG